eukprot:scaffold60963_cov35-Cyclotella_meneghiniana.AAC.2
MAAPKTAILIYMQAILAGLVVIGTIILVSPYSRSVSVKITNPTDRPAAFCWLSPYTKEEITVRKAPEGCDKIEVGRGIDTNTYVGHQFIIMPWKEKEVNNGNEKDPSPSSQPQQRLPHYTFLQIKSGMVRHAINFDSNTAPGPQDLHDLWLMLVRFRNEVRNIICLALLGLHYLFSTSFKGKSKMKSNGKDFKTATMTTLMFHRHSLKAFAVLNMILNHISYSFFPEHSFGRIAGTLPADLVGSAQIFFFLVGYQYHDKKQASIVPRSGNAKILIVFLLLEQFCSLPPPLAFHTLFTIYIARSLISRPEFSPKDGAPDRSFFSEMHPFAHAFFCTLLVGTNQFFNAEGIRMVENASIMYAVAGRLFGAGLADIEGHTSTGTAKEIARTRSWCASLIWLSAAWSWQLKKIWISYPWNNHFGNRPDFPPCCQNGL